ncbi:MAG: NAD(P)/FAD-dependent oxidoreductase [Fibrobacteria bacterium]|nr:NAD(P)/FAD-dependent oxidoreductase [Fibrobacteria bacterium]
MSDPNYNLAVIGGGAAGMLAAGHTAEQGASVLLLEKNKILGKKLLITGKGRCNITNAEDDLKTFITTYGKNGKFLYPAMYTFSNKHTVDFFKKLGLITKVERGGRIFPHSDKAKDVVDCLANYVKKNRVTTKFNSPVKKICLAADKHKLQHIEKLILENGEEIRAHNYAITTGGKSYPLTGSTGDGYCWLKQLGHTVIDPKPVLTPIIVKDKITKQLEGLSLKNVELSLWTTRKLASFFGEALFTGNGISGPQGLNLSKIISESHANNLKIKIDFKPALDYPVLDKRILKDFAELNNKLFKNALHKLLPKKLIPVIIFLSGIDENKKVNEVTKAERKKLLSLLKSFELSVKGLVGFEKAVVTSGGVCLKEINPKTMQSKLIDNLYLAGEVLDIDGPTGGYNLQIAWSTGYLIGENFCKTN